MRETSGTADGSRPGGGDTGQRGTTPDAAALARRYRRLLVAYPRGYRRSRGEELVDVLLDAAADGCAPRPARAAADLIAGGLRARLGRPRSRLVVPLSIVTALFVGLLASAIGYRLAWQAGAGPLPTNAAARQIARTVGTGDVRWTQRDDDVFGWMVGPPHPVLEEIALWPLSSDILIRFGVDDPDLYDIGSVWVESTRRTPVTSAMALRQARSRLRAAGWQVDGRPPPYAGDPDAQLVARKGGYVLSADARTERSRQHGPVLVLDTTIYRAPPAFVWLGQFAAGLLATALAWLVFGWFSRRTDGKRTAYIAYGVLVLGWLPSVSEAIRAVGDAVRGQWLPSSGPITAIVSNDPYLDLISLPALIVLLVLALRPPKRPAPTPVDG